MGSNTRQPERLMTWADSPAGDRRTPSSPGTRPFPSAVPAGPGPAFPARNKGSPDVHASPAAGAGWLRARAGNPARASPPAVPRACCPDSNRRSRSIPRSCPSCRAGSESRSHPAVMLQQTLQPCSLRRLGRLPAALLDARHEAVDRFANGEIEHLAIEGRVIARRAAETDDLAITQRILPGSRGRIHHLRGQHIDDIEGDLGIRGLFLAAAQYAEQLLITRFLAAELDHIAGDHVFGTLEFLLLAAELRLIGRAGHIVAVQHVEPAGLLQVADQDGLGLATQAIDAI